MPYPIVLVYGLYRIAVLWTLQRLLNIELATEHGAISDKDCAVFSIHYLLRAMALLGFGLFLARCGGVAKAEEPPLRSDLVAWTGEAGQSTIFSLSIAAFSNASAPEGVTATLTLDRRLTALPDHRTENCTGVRPVVCSFSIYADHPGSATITVRVNQGVCGLPLTSTMILRDDRGSFSADSTSVGLWGRCALFLPVARR